MTLRNRDPLLFDKPDMRTLLDEMRTDYVNQVNELLKVPVGKVATYQEGGMEDFLCMFNTHVHRYQQAFLYLEQLGCLEQAMTSLHMRSMLLRPDEHAGDLNPLVPTIRQNADLFHVGYDESLVKPDQLTEAQVYTRLVVPLSPEDPLPFSKGQRVYDAMRPDIEPVLASVYPDDHSLLLLWFDQVATLLSPSDPSMLN